MPHPAIKTLLRNAIAAGTQWSGALGVAEVRQRDELTILCYHRVLPRAFRDQHYDHQLVVTPEVFDAHCRVLAQFYEVKPLKEALTCRASSSSSTKPVAAITFDDGYRDNEIFAAPILARYGLKASFFVISGLVGTSEQPWYKRAARLG